MESSQYHCPLKRPCNSLAASGFFHVFSCRSAKGLNVRHPMRVVFCMNFPYATWRAAPVEPCPIWLKQKSCQNLLPPWLLTVLSWLITRSLDHLPPAGGSRAVGLTSKLRCNQRSVAAWNIQRSWRLLLEFHPEARPNPVTLRVNGLV